MMTHGERIEIIRERIGRIGDVALGVDIIWLCNLATELLQERGVLRVHLARLSSDIVGADEKIAALEKERDELRERLTIAERRDKTLSDAVVFAEDYISHFELENDISKPEFLYIRDAAKCLRETDCV